MKGVKKKASRLVYAHPCRVAERRALRRCLPADLLLYSAARCHKSAGALIVRSDLIGTTPSRRRIAASALTLVSVEVWLPLETLNYLRRLVCLSSGDIASGALVSFFF